MGPASNDPARVRRLIDAGVDVFRVNFSHATHADFDRWLALVRTAAKDAGRHVGVLADLQGPKLRIGELEGHRPVTLRTGDAVTITTEPVPGTASRLSTTYTALPRDVKRGDRILIDDGKIELRVESTTADSVVCTVVNGGIVGEHQGLNLPGVAVSSPALTDKDLDDLQHALRGGADFIAISFVRRAEDVAQAKHLVRQSGRTVPVIAKIEKPEAIERLDAILAESDAVMVARGDLGVEMAPERVPTLQKQIIRKAKEHLIPAITATQMLESMISAPRPTRAEASDVANAIIDGTDATMLSGETAIGAYPVESVETMVRIALEAETSFPPRERRRQRVDSDSHAISRAACLITESIDTRAIAAFTRSGFSARIVSKDRPAVPIYAFVPDESIARTLALDWAVTSTVIDFKQSTEELLEAVEREMLRCGAVLPGEAVVVVGGTPMGVRGKTNFLKIVRPGA
ncbi:MAG TPA: pyruvate kinase [Candidatus Eremiobacteraceae bacterium]|nr:pyruvate kinase [Candidatus Eremiobacteraceae bacterium]